VLAVVLVGLLAFARRRGVNLSALGIGVDFLQVVSLFSSFGFAWPSQLTSLFNASSMSTFNEQLMAPECSIGTWTFSRKWVPCCLWCLGSVGAGSTCVPAARSCTSACPLGPCACACVYVRVYMCVAGRWYATQVLPLVFIGGLVAFVVADAARVRACALNRVCGCAVVRGRGQLVGVADVRPPTM
jgi:hypothetical protein